MHFATIKYPDIANGSGIRVSLFVSGCRHHCKECFNQETWDFNYGAPYSNSTEDMILNYLDSKYVTGLSILGGEPMEPENQKTVLNLVKRVRVEHCNKDIWLYSGFTIEELRGEVPSRARTEYTDEILSHIDVLVDGRYVDELKDISLKFRGSSNQRIIYLRR